MNERGGNAPVAAPASTREAVSAERDAAARHTLHGAVLTADLVGFTPLTRGLSAAGPEGIERLHDLLERCFGLLSAAVEQAGGEVVTFAGDSLSVVFGASPADGGDAVTTATAAATNCAVQMQQLLSAGDALQVSGRPDRLSMRIGVGSGEIVRYRVALPGYDAWSALGGPAAMAAARAQALALPGSVAHAQTGLNPEPPADASGGRPPAVPVRPALPSAGHRFTDAHRTVTTAFVNFAADDTGDPGPERLQAVVERTVAVLARTGGRLRQIELTAGGVVLVLGFGTPRSSPDDAAAAVGCCLDLIATGGGAVRAGVTTGDAFCTVLGAAGHREDVVIGDCVNLAARLAQSADPGQLRCDATTADRVRTDAVVEALGPLPLKGQGQVPVYVVLERRRERRRDRGAATGGGPRPPFVGRVAERAEIARHLAVRPPTPSAGTPGLLLVTGEAGMGKTQLVDAVLAGLGPPQRPVVLRGVAGGPGDLRPYLAWRPVFTDVAARLTGSRTASPGSSQAVVAALVDPAGSQLVPVLGPVLGIDLPDTPETSGLTPPQRAEVARGLLTAAVRRLVRRTPTVIVLDDAHRLDELSEQLLRHLLRHVDAGRLAVVLIGREEPGATGPLARFALLPAAATLTLGPLTQADTTDLVAGLLGASGRRGDPAEIARLAARSGGHPLFAEHLVAWSAERAAATDQDDGQSRAHRLPQDVRRLVMARVDRLVPSDQAGLQAAAVLRPEVTVDAVTECLRAVAGDRAGGGDLAHLADVGLLTVVPDVAPTRYVFRDALVREVVYGALSSRTRSALHEAAAVRLERQATAPANGAESAGAGDLVEALAFHYGRTANVAKQRQWYDAAAQAAERAYATATALGHLEALARLTDGAERAAVLTRQGAILQLTGEWSAAEGVLGRARTLGRSAGAELVEARAERELGVVLLATTRYDEAVTCLRRAADRLRAGGDVPGACRALERLTFAQFEHGDLASASESAATHLDLARACDDEATTAAALEHTGLLHWAGGRFDAAIATMREAHRLARRCGDRRLVVHTANDLAGVLVDRGDRAEAVRYCLRALETAQLIGYRQAVAYLTGNLGELYRNHMDLDAARRCHVLGLRAAIDLGDWISTVRGVAALAILAADAGQPGHRALLARAIAVAGRLHQSYTLVELLTRESEAALEDDDPAAAQRSAGRAATIEGLAGSVALRLAMVRARAEVQLGLLSVDEAAAGIRNRLAQAAEAPERVSLLATLARLEPGDRNAYDAAVTECLAWHSGAPTWAAAVTYRQLTGGYDGLPTPPLPTDGLPTDGLPTDGLPSALLPIAVLPSAPPLPGAAAPGAGDLTLPGAGDEPDPAGPQAIEALLAEVERLAVGIGR